MSDLISRQAVIDALSTLHGILYPIRTVEELPPVQPQRMRGKWEVTPIYIKCSECGECYLLMPQNFCPNCGADMRGGGQDET